MPILPRLLLRLFLIPGALLSAHAAPADESHWTYKADTSDPGFRSLPRVLSTSGRVPEDVSIGLDLPLATVFTQFRYGGTDSRRVIVAVAPHADGFELFVDANRDRKIQDKDRIAGSGPVWDVALQAEFVQNNISELVPRRIQIRFVDDILTAGTKGFVAGTVSIGGANYAARRVDGNANGQLTDEVDHLWIDLDKNGVWDPFFERHRYSSLMTVRRQRYSVASGQSHPHLKFEANNETGTVALNVSDDLRRRGLDELSVVLVGRGGTIVHLNQRRRVEVPVDEYRPVSVVATFRREQIPQIWTYTFVSAGSLATSVSTLVAAGETTELDPFRDLRFTAELNRADSIYAPGANIVTTPHLFTKDGLHLQAAFFGRAISAATGEPKAVVQVVRADTEVVLGRKTCGFT